MNFQTRSLIICALLLIYGAETTDVHAVSLADLIATNGTITAGNLRYEHFTASISAEGNASPTTLGQVSVLGGGQSVQFIGPFMARSPVIGPNDAFSISSLILSVRYDVVAPTGIELFSVLAPERATITGVTRTDIGPSAGFTVIESVPSVNPSIGVCSSARFGCPNNDTAFLNTPINGAALAR